MTYLYPDWDFYLETHKRILDEFGGYNGVLRFSREAFEGIMNEVKKVDGLYLQAAVLLNRLRSIRLVEDAQKRTAYIITAAFLEKNGGAIFEKDIRNTDIFMKQDILRYNTEQIAEWLKNGKIK